MESVYKGVVIFCVLLVSMVGANVTDSVRGGLSRGESLLLAALSEKGKSIFKIEDVMAELRCSYEYAKVLVNSLTKKKWLIALKRGVYLIVPLSAGVKSRYTEHEFVIASHLVSPYYIAYWSALNFYGFTEQMPFTVFVATTKRVKSREVLNIKYRFITVSGKKFFGFEPVAVSNFRVNVSDRDKTLADALDHPEYCGGMFEVAKSLWNAKELVSVEKIAGYAERMGNAAIVKRLGYLVEVLDVDVDLNVLSRLRGVISRGMSTFDPTLSKKGRYNTRWNLLLNVSEETFEGWKRNF